MYTRMYVRMYVCTYMYELTHVQQFIATGLSHSLPLHGALEVPKVTASRGGGSGGGKFGMNRQPLCVGLSAG